jgi:FdhD protein
MVQKAAVAGLPIVCGVSAASSLAIDLGRELGVTVVGFLRGEECNIYTGDHRIR